MEGLPLLFKTDNSKNSMKRTMTIIKIWLPPQSKTICKRISTGILTVYSVALNQTRVNYASGEDYSGAEQMLGQISDIRSEAESRIKQALREKHYREKEDMEGLHRQDFESFMMAWDDAIRGFQNVS